MTLKLGLSPVSIRPCSFEEAFRVTAEAGFKGIGLRYDQFTDFLARGGTVGEVRGLLDRYDLRFTEIAFLAEWQFQGLPLICRRQRSGGADEAPDALRRQLQRFLEHCWQLGCVNISVVPALREVGDLAAAAAEFAALCDMARPYGARLCLEFMGSAPQVKDLRTAVQVAQMAGRPNGGLLIDTFLFHQGGSLLSDLETVPLDRVFNVQLADAKPLPRESLNMLEDRLFPGEGAAPVREVVSILQRRGYSGWWTVELFNPDYVASDPKVIAAKAYAAATAIVEGQPASKMGPS